MQLRKTNRREWLTGTAALGLASLLPNSIATAAPQNSGAQIAITLDLEMSRNFPNWEDTHWDYEKGNLDNATKKYTVEAARRVKERGGRIHSFCVGRVLEQEDVSWLSGLAESGHPIGNHTYDHVNVLAANDGAIQYRFKRSPWLINGRKRSEVIRDNIELTTKALKQRIGVDNRGFRTPGGFSDGLNGREDLQQMLLDAGFKWASCKYPRHVNSRPGQQPSEAVYRSIMKAHANAQPFVYPTGLIEIPMSPISDIGAFRSGRWKLEWFLEAIRQSISWAIENKAVFDFLAHPSCIGVVDPDFKAIDLICDLVEASNGKATIVDLDTIAARLA